MTRVYLDPGVVLVRPDTAEAVESPVASDAAEALETLTEAGHEVIFLTSQRVHLPKGFPRIRATPRIDEESAASWYLTSDPELCGRRQPGLRTVLVGPGPATHRAAIQRCDVQTRDLHAAVLEILAREAMTPVG